MPEYGKKEPGREIPAGQMRRPGNSRRKRRHASGPGPKIAAALILTLGIFCAVFFGRRYLLPGSGGKTAGSGTSAAAAGTFSAVPEEAQGGSGQSGDIEVGRKPGDPENAAASGETGTSAADAADGENAAGREIAVNTEETSGSAEMEEALSFHPYHTEQTDPSVLLSYTEIQEDGKKLAAGEAYTPAEEIRFGLPENYTELEGVLTFRGNNFRDAPAFGTAEFASGTLESIWKKHTGSLTFEGKTWSGSGWTGQPLIMKWPASTRAVMNLYPEAKAKEDLTEVIYACMDGNIYFMDLETGEATRDPIHVGWTFKGAGALDPRGLPLLYVGSGYDSTAGKSRAFIISLIDGSILYTFGNGDNFSLRGNLSYFDSSALVDAETDTLIYPGENGILYLIRLNTQYDEAAGTLSIAPDHIVKWHYMPKRSPVGSYWLGMEDSAVVYDGYLFVSDNGGRLMCLDLNTLQPVWAQDILDDSNSTPVLSIEDGHLYLYISTSFHKGWRSSETAEVPVWKIDAENGEIVWQTAYTCTSAEGVSGGVESTIACGKNELSGYVYCTVSKTTGVGTSNGVLCCLDKKTGEKVWEHYAPYAWSSPVCIYNGAGQGRVIYADSCYDLFMLDGKSGEVVFQERFKDGTVEASPAVFNDIMVLGCRGCTIRGFRIR